MDNQPAKQTFFISRAGANAEFARWLATELRSEGHETILQDDDFGHQDFMAAMDRALSGPARVVALYSPAYFASEYCKSEGRHPLGRDPSNEQQKLVPLLIEPAHVGGVFQNIAFTDLLNAREQGASVLRDAIWIALGLTPRDPAAAPAPLRKAGWVHREVYSDPRFKGREDLLAAIHTKLQSGDLLAVKALNGTGGVGKTTLAREYAARHQGEYAGVWWIRAESPETMTTDLIELGERYISGLSEKQDRDASVQQALEAIENHQSDRPWLLVYDNVPEPGALEGMTPRRGAQILATSRHTSWQGRAAEVDVDVFAPDVAVAFLLERTGRSDEAGAGEAAERLGHLPLALEQAAGYLSEAPHMAFTGPGGYLSYLDEMITRAPAGMDADRSVFGAVSLSLETASKQHDKAQALFALIAFMDPERIPVSLLQGADGFTDLDLTEALAALARTSLIKHTPFEDGEAAISVHRLSQDVMRARLGQAGGAEDALGAALGLLWRAWPSTAGDVRYWPECDLLVAHVNRVTQLCDDNTAHHAALRGLLGGLDVLHDARAQYAEAEEASRRALKVAEANLEPGDPAIAIRLHNLAALLQATNRLTEAEPLMRRALAIDEASYGPDHPEVATDLNNLAALLQATNRLTEAEPL
ncbi:MAG: tetratricopeptide repeat protein, partial [Pseudomonadota bacterium]